MSDKMLKLAERLEYQRDTHADDATRELFGEAARALRAAAGSLCEDCPPVGYPTDKTRCTACPRAAAASAEPVAREAVAACLDCLKLETYRPDDDSADYAVTIVGHSKAVDAIMALYTHPAPDAEIVAALSDSAFLAGAKAGWNAANSDNPDAEYQKLVDGRAGYLKPILEARK